ncbi:MAG: hypothetical protein DCO96_13560 [Fluviicola sp. XM-24bin1]|nr:MAG: hypothetical protein DCO96_13560 [Fluviicola sp. XM-24bin1]
MLRTVTLLFLTVLSFTGYSQIIIDNTPTPAQLVTNTLVGPGITTSNITFNGSAIQIGRFYENTSNIGLDSGIVITSGNIADIPGGALSTDLGGAGDPDILATAQSVTSNPNAGLINSTFDAGVLEFDFVPTGEVVVFNFVFASNEYTTYINTQFNDAFGFYIDGPNPNGGNYATENLALVPGTTEPITISTIYPPLNGNPGLNEQYYLDNANGHAWNGFTIPIEIQFDVYCDSVYHFKFAVADCQDGILDTGVFLEGGSFQALPINLSLETNVGGQGGPPDSVIIEGCGTTADLIFTRPECQSLDSLTSAVSIGGTAINGVDYDLLPDTIIFLPGQTEITIPFSAFQDGTFEGLESVIISITQVLNNGDTIVSTGTLYINDNQNVEVNLNDISTCAVDSVDIIAMGSFGIEPYNYVWSTAPNDTVPNDTLTVLGMTNGTTDYIVTIVDACGFTDSDTMTLDIQIPEASFTVDDLQGCIPHVATFTNTSQFATTYDWDFDNNNSYTVTTTTPITESFIDTANVVLIASTSEGCSDTATATIIVEPCGCTDPTALNYNPIATIDDGSCLYPTPVIVAPNVITPNGDNFNDLFFLDATNTTSITLKITNRWGNLIYEGTGDNPAWDGTNLSGDPVEEGVYFYSYDAAGVENQVISGHGFVHVER